MSSRFISVIATMLLSLFTVTAGAWSQTGAEAEHAASVRASIGRRGLGEKATVTIQMWDGTTSRGFIGEALEDSFTLIDARTRQPTTVVYRDVARVNAGRSLLARIAYGVVAAIGRLALLG